MSVTGISNATAVAAGGYYACALLSSGGIKCWGENEAGQLGNGTSISHSTPVGVSGISNAAAITASFSAGETHVCALLPGGAIECWGDGGAGELGNGTVGTEECGRELDFDQTCSLTPVSVNELTTGTVVSAGTFASCAVISSGRIGCWGDNAVGQLGNGTTEGPETCGEPVNRFACSVAPVDVSGITTATNVSAGGFFTCALLSGGGIDCWGENEDGQLGNGTTTNSSTPVAVKGIE